MTTLPPHPDSLPVPDEAADGIFAGIMTAPDNADLVRQVTMIGELMDTKHREADPPVEAAVIDGPRQPVNVRGENEIDTKDRDGDVLRIRAARDGAFLLTINGAAGVILPGPTARALLAWMQGRSK